MTRAPGRRRSARGAALALLATTALAAPATAAKAARIDVMVVGKTRVLAGPASVPLKARTVAVGGRRCAAGRATGLSALLGTRARARVRMRDYGACNRSPRNSGGLYVSRIGSDGERGRSGWVYKVGHRLATAGAADPAGPFGDGRGLRGGQKVLWFYCLTAGACQRTLDAETATPARGAPLRVTVRGYDDAGAGRPIAGATVRIAGTRLRATTGADGVATLAAPRGRHRVVAEKRGLVRSFPAVVRVP